MKSVTSPGAVGTVLDRDTRKPIPGVKAIVSRTYQRDWPDYGLPTVDEAMTNTRPPLVLSGPDGQFIVPPEKKLVFKYPEPQEHARGTLILRKDGYKSATFPLIEGIDDDVGTVVLAPGMDRP